MELLFNEVVIKNVVEEIGYVYLFEEAVVDLVELAVVFAHSDVPFGYETFIKGEVGKLLM